MTAPRKLPPIWLLGCTNATFGLYGGFAVVTLPEMLAAQGIPGGRIAAIVALVLSPAFWSFLLSPILDVHFSRRAYALVFSVVAAASVALTVTFRTHIGAIEIIVITGYTAASLVQGAVGGWMGTLVESEARKEDEPRLGAWFAVSNIGSGGLMMLLSGEIVRHFPAAAARPPPRRRELPPVLLEHPRPCQTPRSPRRPHALPAAGLFFRPH